jgi:hypothetical protein
MANPRAESFTRAAALALPGAVGAIAVAVLASETVFTSISPLENAQGKRARYGNAQAVIRCGEPVQFQQSGFWPGIAQLIWQGHERLKNCAMMEMCR